MLGPTSCVDETGRCGRGDPLTPFVTLCVVWRAHRRSGSLEQPALDQPARRWLAGAGAVVLLEDLRPHVQVGFTAQLDGHETKQRVQARQIAHKALTTAEAPPDGAEDVLDEPHVARLVRRTSDERDCLRVALDPAARRSEPCAYVLCPIACGTVVAVEHF